MSDDAETVVPIHDENVGAQVSADLDARDVVLVFTFDDGAAKARVKLALAVSESRALRENLQLAEQEIEAASSGAPR